MIRLEHENGNLYKLAKGMELLAFARVRKVGYVKSERLNPAYLWYSSRDQYGKVSGTCKAVREILRTSI